MSKFILPPFGDIRVIATAEVSRATRQVDELARRALLGLRFGLEGNDPEVVRVARELVGTLSPDDVSLSPDAVVDNRSRIANWLNVLGLGFETGRLTAEIVQAEPLRERDDGPSFELAPQPRPPVEGSDTFFEVRLVDETGQALGRLGTVFSIEGESPEVTTNAAGVALLDPAPMSSASIAISDVTELEELLDPRWSQVRNGAAKRESNTSEVVFAGGLPGPVALKPAVPNTVVVQPVLGKVHLRLVDKRNRVPHAFRDYKLEGPVSLSGTTNERGELLHESLPYSEFKLSVELADGFAEATAVTLDPTAPIQVRRLGVVSYCEMASLRGLFFPTNKSFLLPATISVFERVRAVYQRNTPSELLIVGHTDTTADAKTNDPLSLERAENTLAFLKDEVDAWLAMYASSVPEVRRWGAEEDEAMIEAMPDFDTIVPGENLVRWFQRTRNLEVDGVLGPVTRRELIREYMDLDGVSLFDPGFEINATVHGAGELFPLEDTQEQVDGAAPDPFEDQGDRRVELFFFDPDFGIQPPPPGENSKPGDTQYLEWRKAAQRSELIDSAAETVTLRCVDELDQAIRGPSFRLVTETGRSFSGTLDADGGARVFVQTRTPCRLFVSGIDESKLGVAETSVTGATTAAVLAASGLEVLPGALSLVRVGLGELLVATDSDAEDLDSVAFTLATSDGSFSKQLRPSSDGTPLNGSNELLFRGLPTLDKTFSLNATHSDGDDVVFSNLSFAELSGVSVDLQAQQVEPTAGGVDGRISVNDSEATIDADAATAVV